MLINDKPLRGDFVIIDKHSLIALIVNRPNDLLTQFPLGTLNNHAVILPKLKSLIRAFAMTIIFRINAVKATIFFFPASTNRL